MAQAHGPVMLLRFGRVPTVVASSAAAAQEVMKTRDLAFASRPRMRMAERLVYGRDVAFVPYGEHWRQARRVCVLHLLSQRRVSSFRHAREQEVAAMLARIRRAAAGGGREGAVNLTAQIISYTNGIISRAAFGDRGRRYYYDGPDDGGGEKLTKLFADFEELLGTVTIGEFVPWLAWVDALMGLDAKATRTSAEMDAFLERVIADHRQRRRSGHRDGDGHRDFVDVLLDVNEDEADAGRAKFDDVSIKAIILDMFAAATDTTYTTLVWAMAELINHPHEMRKVQDEIRAAVAGGGDRVTEDHLEKLCYLRCYLSRVHSFRRAQEQEAAAMVDRVRRRAGGDRGDAAVNLSAILISYTNGVISRAVFGDDDGRSYDGGEGEKLAELFADFEALLGTVTVGELVPWLAWVDTLMGLDAKAARTSREMDALLDRVIADHRQRRCGNRRRPEEDDHRDFVDVLLDVNEAETGGIKFDNVAIKANVLVLFAAATDTAYTTLVWAMAELVNHPHKTRRVQDEIREVVVGSDVVTEDHLDKLRHLRRVIKETLRLHAPVPLLLPRETMEDTELLGYHVPARTRVIVNAWAIARDPATWERADEFVPERFADDGDDDVKTDYLVGQDFRFVPFGAGRRGCPGVGFAAPAMELALVSLLYHFDWEVPAAGGASKVEMEELNGLSVRLKAILRLVAKPWNPR